MCAAVDVVCEGDIGRGGEFEEVWHGGLWSSTEEELAEAQDVRAKIKCEVDHNWFEFSFTFLADGQLCLRGSNKVSRRL